MVMFEGLITDEEIMLLMHEQFTLKTEPTHLNYPRFDINSYTDEQFFECFRFKKADIDRLKFVLRLKDSYKGSNGIKWSGTEGLCMLLRRLCYPNRLVDLIPMFGRHRTEISTIVNEMCREVYGLHHHRLESIYHPWVNFEEYAASVHQRGACLTNCWGFLDGTQMRICRPQEGQESVYNGHKRQHSLKFQSLILPNGIISHFHGPVEGRRHDSALYFFSGLDAQIQQVTDSSGNLMCVYGDSAYSTKPYCLTPFKGSKLSQAETDFNANMATVRGSVEWGFAKIGNNFAFLNFHKNLKVYLQPIAKYYIVGAILTNAHTCLYGSQTGKYFGLLPPQLEEYFY